MVSNQQTVRQRRVGERQRGCTRYSARHVGYAVVHNAVHRKHRIVMISRTRRFTAAALVNGYVNDYRALFHIFEI
ncbi:hypothetical protein SDC9_159744 [bioreactor metagenome]|uniref:Uncharacterized protein n=1 Tax=bioreactor metagenome TaxID=1076179 RepID=A0A645FFP7_9ZZZZ